MPIDFDKIVVEMKNRGAFNDFAAPLYAGEDPGIPITSPSFPGEIAYSRSSVKILEEMDIPQPLIDAKRKSITKAINYYIPHEVMDEWIHDYFAEDFLASPLLRRTLQNARFPGTKTDTPRLPKELTGDLKNAKRKRTDSVLYTEGDIRITRQVCQQMPEIALAVLAYQNSFVEYLHHLNNAIINSKELSRDEKYRGKQVTQILIHSFIPGVTVALDSILPSIAIHYYQNHHETIGEPPTETDFQQGMKSAKDNGMFKKYMPVADDEVRRVSCPAQGIITRSTEVNPQSPHEHEAIGTGLFHIYREIKNQVDNGNQAAIWMVGSINSKINSVSNVVS